jgi:hypothetical protein
MPKIDRRSWRVGQRARNQSAAIGVALIACRKFVGIVMSNLGRFSILACAFLYGTIGLAGVFFLASEPA